MTSLYLVAGLMLSACGAVGWLVHKIMGAKLTRQKEIAKAALETVESYKQDREFTTQLNIAKNTRAITADEKRKAAEAKIKAGDRSAFDNETF